MTVLGNEELYLVDTSVNQSPMLAKSDGSWHRFGNGTIVLYGIVRCGLRCRSMETELPKGKVAVDIAVRPTPGPQHVLRAVPSASGKK